MAQKPGEKYGLGPPLTERRDTSRLSPLEAMIKLHKVEKQKQRIVLNSSLPYARRIDKNNAEWQDAFRKGERKGAGVEILGFDITSMYPNLKIAYIIKEIDRAMLIWLDLKTDEVE